MLGVLKATNLEKVVLVENPKTNHWIMSPKRVEEMFVWLGKNHRSLITPFTLRTIKFIVESLMEDGVGVETTQYTCILFKGRRCFRV